MNNNPSLYHHHEEEYDHDYPLLDDIKGMFDQPSGVIYCIGSILLIISLILAFILE